jgi:uncharacterized protein (DUF58 family)
MIPKELLQKVRRIQITSSRLVNDIFAGQYHSVFKGQGIEFDEVREYQLGDDIRTIDWNVTARTGKAHVKKFVEERELTVMICVDVSLSCRFASENALKAKLAAEIAAVLAFSAIRNKDKVGLIIFTDQIEKFMPPRKGVKSVLKVIREVLYFRPQSAKTDIAWALEYLSKVTNRRSVAFLISDFMDRECLSGEEIPADSRLRKALAIANKKHDVIAITLNDRREAELPDCGLLTLEDAETGERAIVDTTNAGVRAQYRGLADRRWRAREKLFRSVGIDHIPVSTGVPYAKELVKFFSKRRRRLK